MNSILSLVLLHDVIVYPIFFILNIQYRVKAIQKIDKLTEVDKQMISSKSRLKSQFLADQIGSKYIQYNTDIVTLTIHF